VLGLPGDVMEDLLFRKHFNLRGDHRLKAWHYQFG
jgi:hypothetical protein